MIIAAGQTVPQRGNLAANLAEHLSLAQVAADQGAEVIVFPELSLTGYERELSATLALHQDDPRLAPLAELAIQQNITLIAGAPLVSRSPQQPYIGALLFLPSGTRTVYTKHHLHEGEEPYFSPGKENPLLTIGHLQAHCAICADTSHPAHAAQAAKAGAQLYLAGVFWTPSGYAQDLLQLQGYAQMHQMQIVMANFGGPSGGFESGGKSVVLNRSGQVVAQARETGSEVVVASV